MTDIDTSNTDAIDTDAIDSGAAKAAPAPMDGAALLDLAINARVLADALQKGLRQIVPRMTLEHLAALRGLADAGTDGQTLGPRRMATTLAALADLGLVTLAEQPETALLTPEGRDVLERSDAVLAGITAKMNERPKNMGNRAAKIVNQTARTVRGYLRDNPVEGPDTQRKAAKARKSE